jgi:hypothetical protein
MICSAKPGLTVALYEAQKEEFSITWCKCDKQVTHIHSYYTNPSPCHRRCHSDHGRKGFSCKKKLVLSLNELGAKKNWSAVNRESETAGTTGWVRGSHQKTRPRAADRSWWIYTVGSRNLVVDIEDKVRRLSVCYSSKSRAWICESDTTTRN